MKGYKWVARCTDGPEMTPLNANKLDDTACLMLCEEILEGFIKDYNSAAKRDGLQIRGASLSICRNNLSDPFYEALLDVAGTTKEAVMRQVEGRDYGADE